MKKIPLPILSITAAISLIAAFFIPQSITVAAAPPPPPGSIMPRVVYSSPSLSPPLAEIDGSSVAADARDLFTHPRLRPNYPLLDENGSHLQSPVTAANAPVPILSFDGISNIDGVLPPDTNGDVGPNHYVQMVNLSIAVWDKSGNLAAGFPKASNLIWQGFGGQCENSNDGDPIVLYDSYADRWIVSQFVASTPYYECVAVSQTGDPTGAWYRYAFFWDNAKFPDYPKLGVWNDAYYMSVNQFNGNTFVGVGVAALERDRMLAGQSARMVSFDLGTVSLNYWALLPADADGANSPPAGSPAPFLSYDDSLVSGSDSLFLWNFDVDWMNIAASTFGNSLNPSQEILISELDSSLCTSGYCIPQPGTDQKLDDLAYHLMHRMQFRQFSGYQALAANVTVDTNGSGHGGIYWVELRKTSASWALYQEGLFSPDAAHRWMGSIAFDRAGNLALGYSLSSSSLYPSIAITGRYATDTPGVMMTERVIHTGGGSQTSSYGRWGDYAMMSVDPSDDCTFWYTTEYLSSTSDSNWKTRIASFKFPNCSAQPLATLTGQILDLDTGNPVASATVAADSAQTTADGNGYFHFALAAGTYTVRASAFGFLDATDSVTLVTNQTSTLTLTLAPDQMITVKGTVTDAGHPGLPLYAQMETGFAAIPVIFTNPLTGTYSVNLYQHQAYTFTVAAVAPGFITSTRPVTLTVSPQTEDFALQVDHVQCAAPGYKNVGGLRETFDTNTLPAGWSVTDPLLNGDVWTFNDPGGKGNLTGGSGGFAIIDSDFYDLGSKQDSSLVSPAIDFSTFTTVTLSFRTDFEHYATDTADVDVSTDGGAHWTNVWHQIMNTNGLQILDISTSAAGQASVTVRFHYYNGNYDWYWEVDDVFIGPPDCQAQSGGNVEGHARDGNFSIPINGALIAGADMATLTTATPSDPALPDGFYQLFLPAGTSTITASANGYETISQTLSITANTAQQADFSLPAGLFEISSATVTLSLDPNHTASLTLLLENSGNAPATYSITSINADLKTPAVGPFARNGRSSSPKRLLERTARYVYINNPPSMPIWLNNPRVVSQSPISGAVSKAWGLVYLTTTGQTWVNGEQRGQPFLFPSGGSQPVSQHWLSRWAADMAWNPFTSTFLQVNAGYDFCIHEMDLEGAFTGGKICPPFGSSERGLAFDPLTRTYYAGSWTNRLLYHFDENGQMISSISTGLNISGLAFNPASRHLFILTNVPDGYDNLYLYNTENGEWLGSFKISGLSAYGGAGLDMNCDGHLLALDQAGSIFEVDAGEPPACDWNSVSWLSVSPASGTIDAHTSQTLTLTFNTASMIPGLVQAHLHITSNTPYAPLNTAVNLTVNGTALFFPLTIKP